MTRLRIVRPRKDAPRIVATLAGTAVCLVVGFQAGKTIFRPSAVAGGASPDTEAPAVAPELPAVAHDAGARPSAPTSPVAAAAVSAHVAGGLLMGCGDGEEISIASNGCDTPQGFDAAMRAHLAVVATCPSAASAARDPTKVLSLGINVDFERRRVAVLLGRSSSVPEKVSYVACVREGLTGLDDLWALAHAHRRYLWFFNVHFSPRTDGTAEPTPAPTVVVAPTPEPTPAPAPTPEPTPAPTPAPNEGPEAAAGDGGVGAVPIPLDELVRRPATGRATVTWSTAIVRDAPRTGAVVGRVPSGTEVELIERRGGWWAIRWDSAHTPHAGWAWHLAIGQ